ncbi:MULTISPECIES: PoNi-like cognate immunity protein [Bacillus cereus group]|uniref:PoNi-like cognate immunity protein n=1 Tax=Bacillus cereus group TaxID=86661 RepID=UPI0008FE3B35|nr:MULTISPECIES: PoNi-like cognate immunity protein [Bacillus cereus group]MCM0003640.1 PoNi-like cognate immunity protein [Bacillus paranthracis]MCR6792930.1 PoNi-like cognate immunity protein [Bacillus paranthracis]MCU5201833.1 PoNi-like cognate immunity protein [Bacillus paranthracis]MCU5212997.1 PoNi-like cognate immunity protein [Bacillus paranthracis]MED1170038.1 PoNi-like cognate immunity protein [Bacillus paranthracis]
MRDHLCIEEKCKRGIEYHKEFIEENREEIKSLEEDEKNGIQRYPNDNKSIILENYLSNFIHEMNDIRAMYSLGEDISKMEVYFYNAIDDLEHTGASKVGYIYMLWIISLGILLETDKKNIERLKKIVDKKNMNDAVIDFLLCASDIGYTNMTNRYYKENPYAKTKEIIELAQTDKKEASKRLQVYMEKEWFKGHYDYEWKNAHKEPGYVGYWSFETAAIVKILGLDDTSLKDNNHYPYDLAHYKNEMKFKHIDLSEYHYEDETEEIEDIVEGIENNPALENMIPPKWHSLVNELIHDYENMDDSSFYEKYKKTIEIGQVWFLPQEYEEENEQKNLLGSLIVFALTVREYILQLDYKEDLEDYIDNLKNFWNVSETKLVQFMLENDQNYYAWVPKEANIPNMYEVKIESVDVEEVL